MNWALHLGNCLDLASGLASLPDKSVDHVITDPPYAEATHKGARSHKDVDAPSVSFSSIDTSAARAALEECARVSRRWVIATMDWRHVAAFEADPPRGLRFVRFGIWVKPNGAPQFTGDRPATGWEALAVFHSVGGRMRWNGGGNRAVWVFNVEHGDHPTQKPLSLLESLIEQFSDPGELICDPFAGSGTTGVAAIRLGRRFVGWECNEKYHSIAVNRLTGAREQLTLSSRPSIKTEQISLGQLLGFGG